MEQIVKKLEGVIKEVARKDKELTGLIEATKNTKRELQRCIDSIEEKKKDLKEREIKIKGIEDVVLLSKQANDTLSQADNIKKETKITMDAFAKYESDQTKVIRDGILKNKAKSDELKSWEEKLQEKELELDNIITEKIKKIIKK